MTNTVLKLPSNQPLYSFKFRDISGAKLHAKKHLEHENAYLDAIVMLFSHRDQYRVSSSFYSMPLIQQY